MENKKNEQKSKPQMQGPITGAVVVPQPVKIDRLPNRKRKSTVASPVQFVHNLCELLTKDPAIKRKDLIKACIDAGVADYTARTQVQEFYRLRKLAAQAQPASPVQQPGQTA